MRETYERAMTNIAHIIRSNHLSESEKSVALKTAATDYFRSVGMDEKMIMDAAVQAEEIIGGAKRMGQPAPLSARRPMSMIATTRSAVEITGRIQYLNTVMLFNELLLAGEMQRYAYHILDMLKEKGLYRHQLKQYANRLKDVVDNLQVRSNNSDRDIVIKHCMTISGRGLYGKDFYEDGGGLLNRMAVNFSKNYHVKLKRIRLDNKWMADSLNVKHPDLIAEIFTLIALTQTDIELYEEVQRQIRSAGRGRLKHRCIKSTHSENMQNAAKNLLDQFLPRNFTPSEESKKLMRQHLYEFQQDIVGQEQQSFFNGQVLALDMDFIEYYLARLRMDMDKGDVGLTHIRDVWNRLGRKENVRKFFKELAALPARKEDMDAWDYSKVIATSGGKQTAINSFRRLCTDNSYIPSDTDTEEVWDKRVLRMVARKNKGLLPNLVLVGMLAKYKTKKAMMDCLKDAGRELLPTLQRVRKMRRSEIENLEVDG